MNKGPSGIAAIGLATGAALLSRGASAQNPISSGTSTRTATFMVSVIVDSDCLISGTNALSFGHTGPRLKTSAVAALAQTDQATHFSVTCSKNTRYTLYLDQGSVANSTVNARLMAGTSAGNTDKLLYQLYLDPAYSTMWGDGSSSSSNNVSGIGNGAPQAYTVYGRILDQNMPNPDLYSSIITASLTF